MPVRRTAGAAAPAAVRIAAAGGVNFGDDSFYSGGFILPQGNWCFVFDPGCVRYWKSEKSKFGATTGIMAQCFNLDDPTAESREQWYSMGRNAHQSFLPNDDGTGLTAVPNGPAITLSGMDNWSIFRQEMKNSGLPPGFLTDNITVLSGMWVHIEHMQEPQSRTDLKKQDVSEAGENNSSKGPSLIPIVTQFLPGGKPWEGGGGWPATGYAAEVMAPPASHNHAGTAKTVAPAAAKAATPARRVAPVAAPVVAEVVEDAGDEVSLTDAVTDGIGDVLAGNQNGMNKTKFRVESLTVIKKKYDEQTAADAISTYFDNPANLAGLLAQCGFKIVGNDIRPM